MRNTSDIENLIFAMSPGGIEQMEARGQRELCATTELPIDMHPSRAAFESLGIKFGEADDTGLFLKAELPKGWKIEPTDHSMWNKLVNGEGKEVAAIFYKAAFYDRRAFMRLSNNTADVG